MQRHSIAPRPDWQRKVEEYGLVWHSDSGVPYWNESAYYSFSANEITAIEEATHDLYRLFVRAGEALVSHQGDWLDRFAIPHHVQAAIRKAWEDEPPALNYGRFDLGYAPGGPPKLFEFNCDTPTSLLEASVIQWTWKEDLFPDSDQFNSLHEKLVARWRALRTRLDPGAPLHFASAEEHSGEDVVTVAYLRDTAEEAGFETLPLLMDHIGITAEGRFVDHDNLPLRQVFKLYPWEWMVSEDYGRRVIDELGRTIWLEPIWKMLWSNKAILPILYTLEPDNPYLLPATMGAPSAASYVAKPILAREGANVTIVRDGATLARSGGEYGGEGHIYQDLFDLPCFDGKYPVIGSWVVDGEAAGIGIREDGLITGNAAQFVPHIIA